MFKHLLSNWVNDIYPLFVYTNLGQQELGWLIPYPGAPQDKIKYFSDGAYREPSDFTEAEIMRAAEIHNDHKRFRCHDMA